MPAKIKYVAVDPDGGEHTRTSHREYSHAVLVYRLHWEDDPNYWDTLLADMRTWNQPERLAQREAAYEAAKSTPSFGKHTWTCLGFNGRHDLAVKEATKAQARRKPGDKVEIVAVSTK